jgi:hypothetical protein
MKRASVAGVFALGIGLAACGGGSGRDDSGAPAAGDKTADARPFPITETGCLTARGDQFVLTDLERSEGGPTTETFQLIGTNEQLRQHVGKQVRVNGEAEAPKVAVVTESTPTPADRQPTGTSGSADPKVTSETQTRVESRRLTVSSVEPTGELCSAEATDREGAAKPRR